MEAKAAGKLVRLLRRVELRSDAGRVNLILGGLLFIFLSCNALFSELPAMILRFLQKSPLQPAAEVTLKWPTIFFMFCVATTGAVEVLLAHAAQRTGEVPGRRSRDTTLPPSWQNASRRDPQTGNGAGGRPPAP